MDIKNNGRVTIALIASHEATTYAKNMLRKTLTPVLGHEAIHYGWVSDFIDHAVENIEWPGFKGVAVCHDGDQYNREFGEKLAAARARAKMEKKVYKCFRDKFMELDLVLNTMYYALGSSHHKADKSLKYVDTLVESVKK